MERDDQDSRQGDFCDYWTLKDFAEVYTAVCEIESLESVVELKQNALEDFTAIHAEINKLPNDYQAIYYL